ncbi:hypothetical protein SK571_07935 [Lentzea sp. BCCO 10_0798]|uniref:Uncharacterized protein n=1 Tax=Lentzea kristufekii TaxID=3095430 RepID=A0ABU4TN79_9PSEU|nr:hypothetical protein [Lentzea sp. BCCO 10_0798]MDX8049306.1 hypothetical protein [Lentzea sp. BCCO 10_0798]
MTQDDFLGGLNFDGSKRDVEVGPSTGIVRYYPVPTAPPVHPSRWRYVLVFGLGLAVGVVAGVVLCSNFL